MGLGLLIPLLDLVCIWWWFVDTLVVKDWEEDKSGKGLDGGIDKDETDEGNISDVETGIKVSEGKGSDRKVE